MTDTPIAMLHRHAASRPDAAAFIHRDEVWSYRRFATAVRRLAHGLAARGVVKGDRVALHMANLPEMAIAYYACFSLGALAAPLNLRFKAAELTRALERLRPALFIGQASLYAEVASVPRSVLSPRIRFVAGGPVGDSDVGRWDDLLRGGREGPVEVAVDAGEPVALLCTSGTTGEPKFVTHTLASIAATTRLLRHIGLDVGQVPVVPLPMVHSSGFSTFNACIGVGATCALLERFDADAVLDAIERHRGTWLAAMPFMAAALIDRQRERPRDVRSLRFAITAGDVCAPHVQNDFAASFGTRLGSMWAATEAIGTFTPSPQPGPATCVTPGGQARLVDETGIVVAPGEVGELQVRGPNVTPGYWEGPGLIRDTKSDGWYSSGDLMRQTEDGAYWFVARKKDLIIRGGSNIAPAEVEGALMSHPAVADAGVAGIPDDVLGERVAGFVRLAEATGPVSLDEIYAHVRARLADYKVPERIEVVAEIPRNALGKINRPALLGMMSERIVATA